MKEVLVIGGSAFTGRVFSILASRNGAYNLHVLNRGNFPLNLERVTQYKCDRHDVQAMAGMLPGVAFDALVDFCAYSPGDIAPVIEALRGKVKQYIFFSTASIYADGAGFLDECAPLSETPSVAGDTVGEYVQLKAELEEELAESCRKANIKYTILRPTFIYGPLNYAPRESYFIEMIAKKRAVPVPVDASSRFNFIYVFDIAEALMACIGDERASDGIFNLAGGEAITYQRLISEFERCYGGPFATRDVTVGQADAERIPLPFPLTGDTLVDGGKFARVFDFRYTPFSEGMDKTFKVFYSLYV